MVYIGPYYFDFSLHIFLFLHYDYCSVIMERRFIREMCYHVWVEGQQIAFYGQNVTFF